MARLTEYFDIGSRTDLTVEDLLRLMERMYTDLAVEINKKPDVYERDVNGQIGDTFLPNGTININSLTDNVEILTNHPTQTTVTWVQIS